VSLEPWKPLIKAVAQRCRRLGKEETRRLLGPRARPLAEHEPSLAAVPGFQELPHLPPLPGDAARVRLLDALEQTVGALAAAGPVLIILDDLQWVDDLSWALLVRLSAGFLDRNPVLLLGTYREEEMEPARAEALAQVGAGRVRLAQLDDGSVATMIS